MGKCILRTIAGMAVFVGLLALPARPAAAQSPDCAWFCQVNSNGTYFWCGTGQYENEPCYANYPNHIGCADCEVQTRLELAPDGTLRESSKELGLDAVAVIQRLSGPDPTGSITVRRSCDGAITTRVYAAAAVAAVGKATEVIDL